MKDSVIQSAIDQWLIERNEAIKVTRANREDQTPHLWPSDMRSCKRKIALRLRGEKSTVDFEARSLNYMRSGEVMEDETGLALISHYGEPNVDLQHALKWGVWSGKPDFILYHKHKTEQPIIVEHKATGEKSFWNESLPRWGHVGQLALYNYLYQKLYKVEPRLILYYRGWGRYAELELDIGEKNVTIHGYIDGVADLQVMEYNVKAEIDELEKMYQNVTTDENHPLPDKLRYKKDGCTFFGRPSCPMYYHCYAK